MKTIPFQLAKYLKSKGFPQWSLNEVSKWAFDDNGELWEMGYFDQNPYLDYYSECTYFDIWLWLWREKKISIPVEEWVDDFDGEVVGFTSWAGDGFFSEETDQEEAIIAVIEYLVKNDLIK